MRHPITFALLAAALLSFVLQFTMVSVALPDLLEDLDAPLRYGGWALNAFFVTMIVSMSAAGRMVERFGNVTMFRAGVVGFAVMSLACAVAPTFPLFLAARALQGMFGGAIMPSGQAVLGDLHGETERARVVGLFASIMPFGAVAGPFIGGLVTEAGGWRWTFVISVPIIAAVLAGGRTVLPPNGLRRHVRLDLRGALLMLLFIPSLVFALTELGLREATPNPVLVGGGFVVAAVALLLLARHEYRVEDPLLDLDLLRRREFQALNGLAFLFGLAWMGVFAIMPLYVQEGYGMAPAEAGALMGPRSIAMVAMSTASAIVIRRSGFRLPLFIGLVGLSATLLVVSLGLDDPSVGGIQFSSFWWLMVIITTAGLCFGFANPSMNTAGMDLLPRKIASIAGMRGTFMMLGGTVGISLVVMSGARSAEVAAGMEAMFRILAIVLLLALVAVTRVPARPGGPPLDEAGVVDAPGARTEGAPGVASGL